MKLLLARHSVETLKVMAKALVLDQIIPYTGQWRVIKRLPTDAILRLFVLAAKPVDLKDLLRLSNVEAARIEALMAAPEITPRLRERERRALLYEVGAQAWRDAVAVAWARSAAAQTDLSWKKLLSLGARWPRPVMPLTGKDLLAAGLQAGPELGAALKQAEDYWVASDFRADAAKLLSVANGENANAV